MKLHEMVSHTKTNPGKEEIKARTKIAQKMLTVLMKADGDSVSHNSNIFRVADDVAGKVLHVDPMSIKANILRQDAIVNSLANSKMHIVKMNSKLKKMEKALRK